MGFFFDKPVAGNGSERRTNAAIKRRLADIPIRQLGESVAGCAACPLNREAPNLHHPRMPPTGSDDPLLYVIGEAPGRNEDEQGEQFVGRSGELIRDFLPKSLERHTRWNNTVRCRPPGNRTPTRHELIACSQYQVADIEATKPLVVAGFGNVPLQWAMEESGITDWRGTLVPVKIGSHRCWYAPMLHPAYVGRAMNDRKMGAATLSTYKRDLQRVFDALRGGTLEEPWIPEGDDLHSGIAIELSYDLDEVEAALAHLNETYAAQCIDIETNGLRPYSKAAKVLSIAFGTWDASYAIPIAHAQSKWTETEQRQLWRLIDRHLKADGHEFIAHGLKFELEWLSMPWALGRSVLFEVQWGDTMAQAEAIRTQSMHSKSLDARSVALLGVREKALDALDRTRLDEAPLESVLTYNARDVKFTDGVRQYQDAVVEEEGLERAYSLLVNRVPALVIAQQKGLVPNSEFAEAKHVELAAQIDEVEGKIQALPEVRQLVVETGKPFNSASIPQLAVLLRDRLKFKEGWRSEGGAKKYSVDEDTLAKIDHPIARLILEKRGLEKLDGTYVIGLCRREAFAREKGCGKYIHDDGLIHTNFNYLVARTGRLSSDDPNVQNYPIREHPEIRNAIMALVGHKFVAIDYGQIEARVIAMASGCPTLIKALWDRYDIHMDWAKRLASAFPFVMKKYLKRAKEEAKAMKLFRTDIKNVWTFPQFFGSPLAPIAHTLGVPEKNLAPYSSTFWEMFAEVKRWQERMQAMYRQRGYVETLTGRRRHEPMSLNEIINTPIQGTASDIVVESMQTLARMSYEQQRPQIAANINIHDDLTFNIPEETLEQDVADIAHVMCTPQFDFINVPITVEIKVGATWGSMEEVAAVESTEFNYPARH